VIFYDLQGKDEFYNDSQKISLFFTSIYDRCRVIMVTLHDTHVHSCQVVGNDGCSLPVRVLDHSLWVHVFFIIFYKSS
jgi:hypothetical protein